MSESWHGPECTDVTAIRTEPPAHPGLRGPLTVALLSAGAAAYLAVVDPNRPGHYPTCPFLTVTGFWCPFCGGLRAVHDLLHGQFTAALSANLIVVLAMPVVVTLWLGRVRAALTGRPAGARIPGWAGWAILAVVVAFWGLRNLPEMAWLAPS